MRRLLRRIRQAIYTVVILACIVVGAAVFLHFRNGGTVEGLPEAAREWTDTLSVVGDFTGDVGKKIGDIAESAKDYAEDGGDSLARAREGITDAVDRIREPRGDSPSPPPPSRVEEAGSDIVVHFAPVEESLPDGIEDHLEAFILSAQKSVWCAVYDLELVAASDALIRQFRAGRDVRIVTDSHYDKRPALKACHRAGIPIVFDERSAFMHNKFIVVDGERVWTGSANLTVNGMFRNNNNALIIASKGLARNYLSEFEEMYRDRAFGARSPANTPNAVLKIGTVRVENHFAPEDNVRVEIIEEIEEADDTIHFMAFSFTSAEIAEAMIWRRRKGVDVRGLFEKRNAGSQYSKDEFLEDAGVAVYYDTNPNSMHHKVIVIDNDVVVTGSYNFSNNADKRNDENVLIIHSPDIARQFTVEFERLTTAGG